MNIIKIIVAVLLLLSCYQSRAQQTGNEKNLKKKRMFFYPTQETPATSKVRALVLYPNPASNKFDIDLAVKKSEGFELEIHSKPGSLVLSQKWNGEKIDVSAFPAGVYIVTLKRKQEVYSQKLVVNR